MTNREIPLNKSKLLLGVAGSLAFVILGFFLINNASDINSNPILVKGTGIAGVLFFAATGVFAISKFVDKKVGLIINEEGIIDQSSGISLGLIPWSDITKIKSAQVMSTRFLLIHVRNPEQYLAKSGGLKKRMLMANMKMYGTPLAISSNSLKCNFAELEKLIRSGLKAPL
jgi:hypothetical protein